MHAARSAADLEQGQRGEGLDGSSLDWLPPYGFEVLHDVHGPGRRRADADQVIVGPPGVFVVDALTWSGAVMVRDGTVHQNGYSRAKLTESVHRAALVVGLALGAPWASLVVPVICLRGSTALVPTQAGPVAVMSLGRLTGWLLSRPSCLTPTEVRRVLRSLRAALPGIDAVIPAEPSARRLPKSQRRDLQIERRALSRREP